MKKPYRSILDTELSHLEAEIVWKNAQNVVLKERLVRDLHKISKKDRLRSVFVVPLRLVVAAAILLIAFVLVKQEDFRDSDTLQGSFSKGTRTLEQSQLQNRDVSVTFTREEQNMVEGLIGKKEFFLTEEAVIPSDARVLFPSIITGEPEIGARKDQGRVLGSVTYPVNGGGFKSFTIETAINKRGSAKLSYHSLVKRYSGFSTLLIIENHDALLINPANQHGTPQVMIVSDEYIYTITGGKSSDDVVKLAKSIQFIN
ncbi:hypothetical protein QE429_000920 [Bacillus sp. SORGH_AS 510]|uniref:hypothetical protein n=1 Tax=Bacillus sp. SORGH_AS_0510 TaxID=3041771 RepID=UPI002783F8FD|nr:hypothetical protein [Bacillus sp. SORGH_AS_0510]MDQ1144093.1 hypothetical protein [Bacillus sp. SORGH_AS_0510]